MRHLLLLLVFFCAANLHAADELAVNGGFEKPTPDGKRPAGWGWSANVEWMEEGGNHWIKLRDDASVGQTIKLQPDWWKIEVSVRVRCTDVKHGKESWHDARVAMCFVDEKGERVGAWPPVMCWTGTFDWREERKVFKIPRGAKALRISCSIFDTKGIVEFDDLSVKLIARFPKVADAALPGGVKARWDLENAYRQETSTRGRICINGLWRFRPAHELTDSPPRVGDGWGWLKVPASWHPDSGVKPIAPAIWEAEGDYDISTALIGWYRRKVTIPESWRGRRIFFATDNLVRDGVVFVNGREAGRISFPEGRVEITDLITAGKECEIAVRVSALPVSIEEWRRMPEAERKSTARGIRVRGLCGDVFLESEPRGARIQSVLTMPSVRKRSLDLRIALNGLDAKRSYSIIAEVSRNGETVKKWRPERFDPSALKDGYLMVSLPWKNPELWDIDRPVFYELKLRLTNKDGSLLDEFLPVRFGFREFWIDGKDLYLNGRVVHLRGLDFLNIARDGGLASEKACEWVMRNFRDLGMNFLYLGVYQLDWGQVRYLDGVMNAGDRLGFLMSVVMPHPRMFIQARGEEEKKKQRAYWEKLARWMARKAANHPSVIMYAMSHNYLGHPGDQNPRFLDASFTDDSLLSEWTRRNRQSAAEAEKFVNRLDPSRPVYHHQSGNFGKWITLNCYLNWVPIQERMEWLSRFAEAGRKPIFLVEFGLPHKASFQRHRGAPFIWRNEVHAEPLNVEYAAIYFGDDAYNLTGDNIANYDTIARIYERKGKKFRFSQVFGEYWAKRIEKDYLDVMAEYTRFTFPAFRTWGLSAMGAWDWNDFGRPDTRTIELKTDYDALQMPGFKPDWISVSEWYQQPPDKPIDYTIIGKTIRLTNQDILAYIAGKPERFTSRDHIFAPKETIRKQLIFINDFRLPVNFHYRWDARLNGKPIASGEGEISVKAGTVGRVPIEFAIPKVSSDASGSVKLTCKPTADGLEAIAARAQLNDTFAFRVVVPPRGVANDARIGVIDPAGYTSRTLRRLGVKFAAVGADKMPDVDVLIIGREALRFDEERLWEKLEGGYAEAALPPRERLKQPHLDRPPSWLGDFVEKGGSVLICEQSERVLSRIFGFRTAFPGTRRVFVRCPWHPAMRGLDSELMSLWRGSSTLTLSSHTLCPPVGDPVVDWLGFSNTRVWKWGNYGTVASIVIEKPHFGDFLALADCEFDLSYTPLLEYRRGKGRVIFCQLDISDRTEQEPTVQRVWSNLIQYLSVPSEITRRRTLFVGDSRTKALLEKSAIAHTESGEIQPDDLLIIGGGHKLERGKIASAVEKGTIVFALDADAVKDSLPFEVTTEEQLVTLCEIDDSDLWLVRGIGRSELHWRGRIPVRVLKKLPEGAFATKPAVIAAVPWGKGWFVFCQISPDIFDEEAKPYLRLSRQRAAQMLSRLLANCGATFNDPLPKFLSQPAPAELDLAGEWLARTDEQNKGEKAGWHKPDFDDSNWMKLHVPAFWEDEAEALKNYDGVLWYRKRFRLPEEISAPIELIINGIDDEDWAYVNGRLVGHIGEDTNPDNYWMAERRYPIPLELLNLGGENVIAIKVRDLRQAGGFRAEPVAIRSKPRWLKSFYINEPIATDDPYRYCRW